MDFYHWQTVATVSINLVLFCHRDLFHKCSGLGAPTLGVVIKGSNPTRFAT